MMKYLLLFFVTISLYSQEVTVQLKNSEYKEPLAKLC